MKHKLYTLNNSWLRKSIAAGALMLATLFSANAQTQLVEWDFSNFNNTPSAALP